jgi:hypothetical protein
MSGLVVSNTNEILLVKEWLRECLLADPDIEALVGDRCKGIPVGNGTWPAIGYSHMSALDIKIVQGERVLVEQIWQVVAVDKTDEINETLAILANKIEFVIGNMNSIPTDRNRWGIVLSCSREGTVEVPFVDREDNDTQYQFLGALWKIRSQGAAV